MRKVDEQRYAQRFTPRKAKSPWSESNIARVKKLIAAKKMTPAGLAAFASHAERKVAPQPTELPRELAAAFKRAKTAWKNFQNFPPGYQRMTIGWVASAKRQETRERRLALLIEHSARNERLDFM